MRFPIDNLSLGKRLISNGANHVKKNLKAPLSPLSPKSAKIFDTIKKVIRTKPLTKLNGSKSSSQFEQGWRKQKKVQQDLKFFGAVPSRFRLATKVSIDKMDYNVKGRWKDLEIIQTNIDAMNHMGIIRPNPMQICVIPRLLKENCSLLFAAETGSGKTLAYLLPVMEKLKREEQDDPKIREPSSPRAIILVPSNELVNQTYSVAKSISHFTKLTVEMISGAQDMEKKFQMFSKKLVDLVISTPAQLLRLHEGFGLIKLDKIKHLVIDEGDTLLSDDFAEQIKSIKKLIANDLSTIAVCSATIPVSLQDQIGRLFPNMVKIASPQIHMASPRVDIRFIDVQRPGNAKLQTCEDLIAKSNDKSTLVFCNTSSMATKIHRIITENTSLIESLGHVPTLIHGAIPEKQRQTLINKFQDREIKILICTDLASRGLDTVQVEHVIMYDFPRNTIDFIHRAGRTGRLHGTRGLVNCLVSARDRELAKTIKKAIKSELSLTDQFS